MKVLVVEDEHKIANSIKRGLEQEHFAVDVAYDGESGYDLASSEQYDVIILDLMLPKMSGIQVCTDLRKEGIHTPVLMLTAKGQIDEKVQGLNIGADDYMVKPFAFSELIARIKALARRPQKALSTVLTCDNLVLDTISYEVTRNGTPIQLSKKEFALLAYLLGHINQILTKEQIIQNVWNYESDILPNTVEVYIGYLRQKVDKPFPKSHQLIQTHRGFGYKIAIPS
jgi:DNA-binding response OmpR family regulator